jgi:hypothetical protein
MGSPRSWPRPAFTAGDHREPELNSCREALIGLRPEACLLLAGEGHREGRRLGMFIGGIRVAILAPL